MLLGDKNAVGLLRWEISARCVTSETRGAEFDQGAIWISRRCELVLRTKRGIHLGSAGFIFGARDLSWVRGIHLGSA